MCFTMKLRAIAVLGCADSYFLGRRDKEIGLDRGRDKAVSNVCECNCCSVAARRPNEPVLAGTHLIQDKCILDFAKGGCLDQCKILVPSEDLQFASVVLSEQFCAVKCEAYDEEEHTECVDRGKQDEGALSETAVATSQDDVPTKSMVVQRVAHSLTESDGLPKSLDLSATEFEEQADNIVATASKEADKSEEAAAKARAALFPGGDKK